jgi:hypothetical protein
VIDDSGEYQPAWWLRPRSCGVTLLPSATSWVHRELLSMWALACAITAWRGELAIDCQAAVSGDLALETLDLQLGAGLGVA